MRRWKLKAKVLATLSILLMLAGCSDVRGKLLVMEGNFRFSCGMFTEAIASYIRALNYEEALPFAEYGLGSVYFALGEDAAALARFEAALQALETVPIAANRELRYRIHFNTGVVLFSQQDFTAAAGSFRDALRVDSRKVEAKRNLELSLLSLEREPTRNGEGGNAEAESLAILFEFIRQREINQHRSREWGEEEITDEPDY